MNRSIAAARVKGGGFIRYHVNTQGSHYFAFVRFNSSVVLLYLKVLLVVK